MRAPWLLILVLSLPLAACQDEADDDSAAGDDDAADDDDSAAGPQLPTAGEDLDERATRELAAGWELPGAFYDGLDALGVGLEDLNYPDAGSTFDNTETRLHWTDTLRHDGERAPTFAHMVAEDVEGALAMGDDDGRLRDLLVAQYTYNDRDDYVTSRYDRQYVLAEGDDQPLLTALQVWYEHEPVAGHPDPPAESWAEIAEGVTDDVRDFPLAMQEPLALAIYALIDVAEMRDEALTSKGVLDMDEWAALHDTYYNGNTDYSTYSHDFGTDAHPGVDWELLARAGQLALRAVESLRIALADVPPEGGAMLGLVGPLGKIKLRLDDDDDEYSHGDYFLIVDAAGDDLYQDQVCTNTSIHLPVSVLLDLEGADTYTHTGGWEIEDGYIPLLSARMQAAGIFGIAVLDDAQGDDTYHAPALAQGAGVFGVGVLADHGGNDVYRGYYDCQGHAQFGYGLLVDLGDGDDRYETLQQSQGYGGPRGIGWLVDEAGDDTYLAIEEPIVWDWAGEGTNWTGGQGFGYGVRDGYFEAGAPIFSGGLGALFDLDGNDSFQCAVMCQGFGYAFGTGLFYDAAGDDDHLTTHKYSLGSATHWAVGLYVDVQGADTYRNDGDDECIAEGYDASVAFHIDRGEEADTYTLDNAGDFTLGVSRIPALGVFLNEGGDDEYHVPGAGNRAIGRTYTADGNRDGYLGAVASVGMFFDLGGTDVYDIAREEVTNGGEWIQTDPDGGDWDPLYDFGYGLDAD